MKIDASTVRSVAQGRWQNIILPALGIEAPHNPRKHVPCPFCGGKDRFRFDDQDGRGTWFCNQCVPQAGDGFALVMKVRRLEFRDALKLVADALGLDSTAHARPYRPLPSPPVRIDLRAHAFQFELGGLDLRLRAERIAQAGRLLSIGTLTDAELDRALALVARGYADVERAELFESVADGLRSKEFFERENRERTRAA